MLLFVCGYCLGGLLKCVFMVEVGWLSSVLFVCMGVSMVYVYIDISVIVRSVVFCYVD